MQEIIEHYGIALLTVSVLTGVMGMVYSCMEVDGIIYRFVEIFMQSICG